MSGGHYEYLYAKEKGFAVTFYGDDEVMIGVAWCRTRPAVGDIITLRWEMAGQPYRSMKIQVLSIEYDALLVAGSASINDSRNAADNRLVVTCRLIM